VKFAAGPSGAGVFAFDRGDFNGDGKTDLAFAGSGGVSVALGDGAGGFGSPRKFTTPATPTRVVVADFNGDSKLDIGVLIPGASQTVAVLIGQGNGFFSLPLTTSANGNDPVGLATGTSIMIPARSGGDESIGWH
jgi:hypothetical protein